MKQCWDIDIAGRPTFKELGRELRRLADDEKESHL